MLFAFEKSKYHFIFLFISLNSYLFIQKLWPKAIALNDIDIVSIYWENQIDVIYVERILGFDGPLFNIARVQIDWGFVFVGASDGFALLDDLLNFRTIFTFWQFFNSYIILEFALFIDESNFGEETFAEFL